MQRAAAEKLFTHSGSQPDLAAADASDSADEDAGNVAAASATSPAAAASAMSPATAAPGNGYQAAEGKRQRQKLLGQLREAVPPSAARLLVAPLLDGSICDPPSAAAGPLSAQTRAPAATDPGGAPSGAPLRQHGNRVAAEVWRTALIALAQQWPALPGLLALGATERLTSTVQAASDDSGDDARWAAWLTALLQPEVPAVSAPKGGHRSPAASPSAKRKRADAATQAAAESGVMRLWTPDPQQTACLVRKCLAASASRGAASPGSQRLLSGSVAALLSATTPQDASLVTELAQRVGITAAKTSGRASVALLSADRCTCPSLQARKLCCDLNGKTAVTVEGASAEAAIEGLQVCSQCSSRWPRADMLLPFSLFMTIGGLLMTVCCMTPAPPDRLHSSWRHCWRNASPRGLVLTKRPTRLPGAVACPLMLAS